MFEVTICTSISSWADSYGSSAPWVEHMGKRDGWWYWSQICVTTSEPFDVLPPVFYPVFALRLSAIKANAERRFAMSWLTLNSSRVFWLLDRKSESFSSLVFCSMPFSSQFFCLFFSSSFNHHPLSISARALSIPHSIPSTCRLSFLLCCCISFSWASTPLTTLRCAFQSW